MRCELIWCMQVWVVRNSTCLMRQPGIPEDAPLQHASPRKIGLQNAAA
jgi:hypothetical protein